MLQANLGRIGCDAISRAIFGRSSEIVERYCGLGGTVSMKGSCAI